MCKNILPAEEIASVINKCIKNILSVKGITPINAIIDNVV